jgi:hypothetical protein
MKPSGRFLPKFAAGLLTFHFVLLAWIFFRAATTAAALQILSQIASLHFSVANATPQFLVVLGLAAAAHFVPKTWYDLSLTGFNRIPAVAQAAAMILLLVAIRKVSATGAAPFIYSKF